MVAVTHSQPQRTQRHPVSPTAIAMMMNIVNWSRPAPTAPKSPMHCHLEISFAKFERKRSRAPLTPWLTQVPQVRITRPKKPAQETSATQHAKPLGPVNHVKRTPGATRTATVLMVRSAMLMTFVYPLRATAKAMMFSLSVMVSVSQSTLAMMAAPFCVTWNHRSATMVLSLR